MRVEVYGVDESVAHCYSCIDTKRILEQEAKVSYTFHNVLSKDDSGALVYDLDQIDFLVQRANLPSRRITYPIIFINGERVLKKDLRQKLFDLGCDVDVF